MMKTYFGDCAVFEYPFCNDINEIKGIGDANELPNVGNNVSNDEVVDLVGDNDVHLHDTSASESDGHDHDFQGDQDNDELDDDDNENNKDNNRGDT